MENFHHLISRTHTLAIEDLPNHANIFSVFLLLSEGYQVSSLRMCVEIIMAVYLFIPSMLHYYSTGISLIAHDSHSFYKKKRMLSFQPSGSRIHERRVWVNSTGFSFSASLSHPGRGLQPVSATSPSTYVCSIGMAVTCIRANHYAESLHSLIPEGKVQGASTPSNNPETEGQNNQRPSGIGPSSQSWV